MNKLTAFLISGVLLVGAVACDGGAKTADGPNTDTTQTGQSPNAATSPTTGTSPDAATFPTAGTSPDAATSPTTGTSPDAATSPGSQSPGAGTASSDKAAQDDATNPVRKAQIESDKRARDDRNKVAGNPENRSDGDLESLVRGKLEVNIPKSKLTVKAKDGALTVTGTVPAQNDVTKIDKLAKEIQGVKSVTNQAKVGK